MARNPSRRVREAMGFLEPDSLVIDGAGEHTAASGPEIDGGMAGSRHQRFAT
jgi:hypothetical protein